MTRGSTTVGVASAVAIALLLILHERWPVGLLAGALCVLLCWRMIAAYRSGAYAATATRGVKLRGVWLSAFFGLASFVIAFVVVFVIAHRGHW